MPIVADVADLVVGIDTHRDRHQLEIATSSAQVLATASISNDDAGFARCVELIAAYAGGPNVYVGVEGSRSYGIGLSRALHSAGLVVIEVEQPVRKARRGKGKSDLIDAHLAVLFTVNCDLDRLPTPRADGDREALRILLGAREELTTSSTVTTNRLRALLLSGDDHDRTLARGTMPKTVLSMISRRRTPTACTRADLVRHHELRRLAAALLRLRGELTTNKRHLAEIVNDLAPGLTLQPGIGPVSAAAAIIAFSHTGRCRSDAAFAKLAGTSPLEASSGQTNRHRLNRGGDRKLNHAIHTIAVTRIRCDPATRDYVTRRTAEGKTPREIRRCIKRYITRQLYRQLNNAPSPVDNT